jgi:hypothetical protein
VIGTVLFGLISLTYLGVIVNPTSHLRGLPVLIVNEDSAPPHFSADVTALASGAYPRGQAPALPTLTLLTNVRAGSLGVSLAIGVLQPAVAALSLQVGTRLEGAASPAIAAYAPARALLANPVGLVSATYRPLPANAGLGQAPFFIALFVVLCGFIGAILINSAFDSIIGYAITEVAAHGCPAPVGAVAVRQLRRGDDRDRHPCPHRRRLGTLGQMARRSPAAPGGHR